jgi:hypothetical protein
VSYAQASIELVQDSDPSLTGVLEATIAGAMATELDRIKSRKESGEAEWLPTHLRPLPHRRESPASFALSGFSDSWLFLAHLHLPD